MSPNTAGVTNLVDPQTRLIAVPATGNPAALISASVMAGYVEIQEMPLTPSSQLQGCTLQRADENYANSYPLPPGSIWPIGDPIRKNRCEGVPQITMADSNVRPATPWIKIVSNGAATQVQVREWRQQYNN